MSSISPLSGYGSGSRRDRRDRRGQSEGPAVRRVGAVPYTLANVPPMFPLQGFSRTRRASAGGLPPPVPGYAHAVGGPATDRPACSTWRSLSPSRPGNGKRNGWSISPVLRSRSGPHIDGAWPSYVSPSARMGGGSVDGSRREAGRAGLISLPPHRVFPEREKKSPAESSASVAKLGQAMGMSFPGKTSSVRPLGGDPSDPGAAHVQSGSTTPSGHYQQPLVSPSGSMSVEAVETTGATTSSGEKPSAAQPTPPGADGTGRPAFFSAPSVAEVSSSGRGGNGASPPSPRDSIARQDPKVPSPGLPVPPAASTLSSNGAFNAAPEAEVSLSRRSPPTVQAMDQQWVEGLSEAAVPVSDEKGPSDDISRAGADAARKDSVESCGKDVARPPPPPLSSDVFGLTAGEIGVTAGPSPFVNTSSPLTRGRNNGQEPFMFGGDGSGDGENGGSGDVSGAADLFATEAPARAADELFSSHRSDAHEATSDAGQSSGPSGSGSGPDSSMFSQGPPPEAPPPPSLPNPWGSSPLKHPLPEPKRWPTKGVTGFDRPLTPLATEQKVPGGENAAAASAEAGAIPAAFSGAAEAEFKDSKRRVAGAPGRVAPASFMPPAVAAPRLGAAVAGTQSWKSGSNGSFDGASRRSAAVAAKPAPSFYGHGGGGGGFGRYSGRSGDAAWGSGSAKGATAADSAARDPSVRPPGVFAVFGFGGRLVCMHPKRKLRLAPVPGVGTSSGDGPALRKGPIKVRARGGKESNACPPKGGGGACSTVDEVGRSMCVSSVLIP